ncbi:MAG: LytR C-terminal domain-containing protein, partial [Acidimicrobiales bacterium]
MSQRAHNSGDGSFARDAGTQTGKAVALVAVLVLVGILLLHHTGSTKVATGGGVPGGHHTTTTSQATTTTTVVAPSTIKLQVLNGVLSGALAGEWSNKLREGAGYNTLAPDNATAKVASSQIYVVTPGDLPAAEQLAALIGLTPAAVVSTI